MKKIIKNRLFIALITTIIVASGTLYAANKYQASEVVYNKKNGTTTDVNTALNDIYNITKLGDATSEDIAKGKTAVVQGKLVTGQGSLSSDDTFIAKNYNGSWLARNSSQTYKYDLSNDFSKISYVSMFCTNADDYNHSSSSIVFDGTTVTVYFVTNSNSSSFGFWVIGERK